MNFHEEIAALETEYRSLEAAQGRYSGTDAAGMHQTRMREVHERIGLLRLQVRNEEARMSADELYWATRPPPDPPAPAPELDRFGVPIPKATPAPRTATEQYADLLGANPLVAAQYGARHESEIDFAALRAAGVIR
jgi:phosphoglycolate phosphatase-like HAD superfamily hydrolase